LKESRGVIESPELCQPYRLASIIEEVLLAFFISTYSMSKFMIANTRLFDIRTIKAIVLFILGLTAIGFFTHNANPD